MDDRTFLVNKIKGSLLILIPPWPSQSHVYALRKPYITHTRTLSHTALATITLFKRFNRLH